MAVELTGKITNYNPKTGELTIKTIYDDMQDMMRKGYDTVGVLLEDGRTITSDQRRKAYAMEGDIGRWAGYITQEDRAELHEMLKDYHCQKLNKTPFSLSDCSITEAREYITTLIDFAVENEVPCIDLLLNRAEDIDRYIYTCMWHRKCTICGRPADLHHVDRIGMGRNRKTVIHTGMEAMALCRIHHDEAHSMGQRSFDEKYHIYGVEMDWMLVKHLKLGTEIA